MSQSAVVIGLGSSACMSLRELPEDRDFFRNRIAVDADASVLNALAGDVDLRLKLALPRRYIKKPRAAAAAQLLEAWEKLSGPLSEAVGSTPTMVFLCVGLGGMTGSTLAVPALTLLGSQGHRTVTAALWGAGCGRTESQSPLTEIAERSLSLCVVNPGALGTALGRQESVQRWLALCSMVRVGHLLDWQRLATILQPRSPVSA